MAEEIVQNLKKKRLSNRIVKGTEENENEMINT